MSNESIDFQSNNLLKSNTSSPMRHHSSPMSKSTDISSTQSSREVILNKCRRAIEVLHVDLDKYKSLYEESREVNTQLRMQLSAVELDLSEANRNLQISLNDYEKLKVENDQISKTLNTLQSDQLESTRVLKEGRDELSVERKNSQNLQYKITTLQGNIDGLNLEVDNLSRRNKELSCQNEKLQLSINEYRDTKSQNEESFHQIKNDYDDKINTLNCENKKITESNEKLTCENAKLLEENKKYFDEIESLKKSTTEYKNNMESENVELKTTNTKLLDKYNKLEDDYLQLNKLNHETSLKNSEYFNMTKDLEKEIHLLKDNHDVEIQEIRFNNQSEIEKLKKSLEEVNLSILNLNGINEELSNKNINLSREKNDINDIHKQLYDEYNLLMKENEILKKSYESQSEKLGNIERDNKVLKEEMILLNRSKNNSDLEMKIIRERHEKEVDEIIKTYTEKINLLMKNLMARDEFEKELHLLFENELNRV